MKAITKVILGIGAAALGIGGAVAAKKHHDKKQEAKSEDDIYAEKASERDLKDYVKHSSFKTSFKEFIGKKTIQFLAFVGKHEKEVKEVTLLLSAAAAAIELLAGLRKFHSAKQMVSDISWIKDNLGLSTKEGKEMFDQGYDSCFCEVKARLDYAAKSGNPYAMKFGDGSDTIFRYAISQAV